MPGWIENLVEELRAEAGETGFPRPETLGWLIGRLREWVEVRYTPASVARCYHRRNRPALACIPRQLQGHEEMETVLEEVGHGRLTTGMAALLRQISANRGEDGSDSGLAWLADRWEGRDERLVRVWVLTWLLPRSEMETRSDAEIHDLTGYPWELIQERRKMLREEAYQARMQTLIADRIRQEVSAHYE